jgi:transcription termination/antitermination protein NusG
MISPSSNPPPRFPDRPIADATSPWWVAKVKPRMEKALAFDFIKQDIEYYLPMYTKVTRRKDNNKPRKSILPLFPGYIAFSMKVPQGIFVTGRVVNIVEIRHQKRFIEEIGQIYLALEKGIAVEPCFDAIPTGTLVEVMAGPLRGIKGIVSRAQSQSKLVLEVEGLGRASIAIDTALVRPLKEHGLIES